MKLEEKNPPRKFEVGAKAKVTLSDCGRLKLEPDEQITLVTENGSEYDVARKSWGYYATPSLNGRLPKFRLRAALVSNESGHCYVLLVEDGKEPLFEAYLKNHDLRVVIWLDEQGLRRLDTLT